MIRICVRLKERTIYLHHDRQSNKYHIKSDSSIYCLYHPTM